MCYRKNNTKRSNVVQFIIIIIKCLIILIFFGLLLPKLIEYILTISFYKSYYQHNSTFVDNIRGGKENIVSNFIYLFDLFLKQFSS